MEKIHLYDKILSPVVTEKSTNLSELNKIVFKVTRGKKVKVSGYKKAIITLKKGQSIDLTTGI
jgi:large subunit ribosomal protein L23